MRRKTKSVEPCAEIINPPAVNFSQGAAEPLHVSRSPADIVEERNQVCASSPKQSRGSSRSPRGVFNASKRNADSLILFFRGKLLKFLRRDANFLKRLLCGLAFLINAEHALLEPAERSTDGVDAGSRTLRCFFECLDELKRNTQLVGSIPQLLDTLV